MLLQLKLLLVIEMDETVAAQGEESADVRKQETVKDTEQVTDDENEENCEQVAVDDQEAFDYFWFLVGYKPKNV